MVLSPKLFVSISFALLSLTAYTQEKNTNEIIAEGGSKIKVSPDVAMFTLTVKKTDTVEKRAIENLNAEVFNLTKALYQIGFTSTTIKIADYDVSSALDDNNKKKYTASNALNLEFGLDTKLINEVYKVIQETKLNDVDISFDTRVSDSLEKRARLILVQQAIADAKSNADNISHALNVRIIGVKRVMKYTSSLLDDEKVEIVQFTPPKIVRDTELRYNTSFNKLQVEGVELEERITIIYEISG